MQRMHSWMKGEVVERLCGPAVGVSGWAAVGDRDLVAEKGAERFAEGICSSHPTYRRRYMA